jgi:hypothetical protein
MIAIESGDQRVSGATAFKSPFYGYTASIVTTGGFAILRQLVSASVS